MIVNVRFLSLLSFLVILGDILSRVAANELAPNASPDYSSEERKGVCHKGWCTWVCPGLWCWVAYRGRTGPGTTGWLWRSCSGDDDCWVQSDSCRHEVSAENIFKGRAGKPYESDICPWISAAHQAEIDKKNRIADEANRKAQEEYEMKWEKERRRIVKCFKPELTPEEDEYYYPHFLKQLYNMRTHGGYTQENYRTPTCSSNGWCEWHCNTSHESESCWVASTTKGNEPATASWQWLKCKTVDDCGADGDARVCRRYDPKVSDDPLEEVELTCPFESEALKTEKKQEAEIKRWMKCAKPDATPKEIETDFGQLKPEDGSYGDASGEWSYLLHVYYLEYDHSYATV